MTPRGRDGFVYFIHAVGAGWVKIGYSRNVQIRLIELQCASPHQLELLHMIPGSYALETLARWVLSDVQGRGEWKRLTSRVLDLIEELRVNPGREADVLALRWATQVTEFRERVERNAATAHAAMGLPLPAPLHWGALYARADMLIAELIPFSSAGRAA